MHYISSSELVYDLFRGNNVFTTGLLENPLNEGNNIYIREWNNVYLGCLNYYDLIITKLFRGTSVDFRDVFLLWQEKHSEIDCNKLIARYREHALYDLTPEKRMDDLEIFLNQINKEGYCEE